MKFNNLILNWYQVNKRNLPWRSTKNPYNIWLSEIILQQTQVVQGLPYYNSFVTHYPTIYDLAKAEEDDVLKLWQGLGYYSRARNLHYTAKYIVKSLKGEFPKSYKELVKLKGIGDYTASAIASICYDEPCAVVDGNVYRVLARYFGIDTPINSSQGIKQFKHLAQQYLIHSNPGDYNQAIMEFGAKQCKPKSPNCVACSLKVNCDAFQLNKIGTLPVKLKKIKIKHRYFNYLVCISDNQMVAVEQRLGSGIWKNLYQFPLIETTSAIAEDELIVNAQFKALLGDNYSSLYLFNEKAIVHKLSHQHLHTNFWIVHLNAPLPNSVFVKHLKTLAVPQLISNFIDAYNFS